MELRKAYLGMIKAFAGGWDAMCGAVCMSRTSLENRIYERKGQAVDVDTALQMQAFSNTTLFAEAIATLSGGTFIKLPSVDHIDNDDLLAKFNELYAELGRLSQTYAAAIDDGEIDKRERADLTSISNQIHKTMQELMSLMFRIYCRKDENVSQFPELRA